MKFSETEKFNELVPTMADWIIQNGIKVQNKYSNAESYKVGKCIYHLCNDSVYTTGGFMIQPLNPNTNYKIQYYNSFFNLYLKMTSGKKSGKNRKSPTDWKTFDKYVETVLSDTHANQVNGIKNNEMAEFFETVFNKYKNESAHGWYFIVDSNGFNTMVSKNYLDKFRYGINAALNESYELFDESDWKYEFKKSLLSDKDLCYFLEQFSFHWENENEKEFYTCIKNSGYWNHDFSPWVKSDTESKSIQILD